MSARRHISVQSPDDIGSALAPVAAAVRASMDEGDAAWVVGGAVRDAALGRTIDDADISTTADPRRLAWALATRLGGTSFPLDEERGYWRVVPAPGATQLNGVGGVAQIDICALVGGTFETDIAARDFTINALAWSCAEGGTLIDRVDGMTALAEGHIQVVSDHAIDDDPLRMIRAVRFARELAFTITDATVEIIRASSARAAEPAGERTWAEFVRVLMAPEAARGMRQLDDVGLLAPLLPELEACRGLAQSRFHHLDVFDHTLAVLDNVEDIARNVDFYLGGRDIDTVGDASDSQFDVSAQLTLKLAALMHDLGKPGTHAINPENGRVSFVGHDATGVAIVDAICARWATSNHQRDALRLLVKTHLELGWLLHGPRDARAIWTYLRTVDPYAREAVALSMADRMATAGVGDRRRWVRRHMQVGQLVWRAAVRERSEGVPTPLLTGAEIIAATEIDPGPQVGELVRLLAREQSVGAVTTRDAAIDLVRAAVSETAVPQLP